MPPKKKEKKASADNEDDPGLSPGVLLQNYTKFCKLICIPANQKIVNTLTNDESVEIFVKTKQLVVDDEFGSLGPTGTRALCTAIMGTGPGMVNAPCRLIKFIRMWRCNINDDGVACLAELLRLGGAEVPISYLELLDNNIGPDGALCLGQSLQFGQNKSLVTLKLDYNRSLGSEGVAALCQGLRTNSTLRQLHLPYCAIQPDGGAPLGEMLTYRLLGLDLLNLQGNQLNGLGLRDLCNGLAVNQSLTTLSIADNGIGQNEDDVLAVKKLAAVLMTESSKLVAVDMLYNRIGTKGGEAMLDIFGGKKTPPKVKQLMIDSTLPDPLFECLCRVEVGGGKGKKKKGGKKKKK